MANKRLQFGEFDVDRVLRAVLNARNAKAPFVGIPLIGCSPFIVKRELLINGLQGIKVIEAAVQIPLPGMSGEGYLQVFGFNEFGGKYICKFAAQRKDVARDANWAWAESERKRREKALSPAATKADRSRAKYIAHIAKLEKRIQKMYFNPRPRHRILHESSHSDNWYRSAGETWAKFRREKPRRKLAMKLARDLTKQAREHRKEHGYYPVDSGHSTVKDLYKIARKNGLAVRTISELSTAEKESLMRESHGMVFPYLNRFWEFCGLTKLDRYGEFRPAEYREDDYGPGHYAGWIAELRERNAMLSEIASCRELISSLDEMRQADEIAASAGAGEEKENSNFEMEEAAHG